jgi:hypothetical protein
MAAAAVGVLIGILEGEGPSFNAPIEDVLAYIDTRSGTLKLANTLRFALLPLLPIFAAGAYLWLGPAAGGWRLVGMLGVALVPALGFPANAATTIALWRLSSLQDQPELATMLWSMTVVLFPGALMMWGVGIAGFSIGGWQSARMRLWLAALGWFIGALGIGSAVAASALLSREVLAGVVLSAFGLLAPVWVVAVSVGLVRAAKRERA